MTIILLAALVVSPIALWRMIGGGVLRSGYVPVQSKSSTETQEGNRAHRVARHQGALHVVMVDHVDPTLVLVVLRLDGGGQRILSVRTDYQGFGNARLLAWSEVGCRIIVTEKVRAGEVVFRPITERPTRLPSRSVPTWPMWNDRPLGQLGS
jgi:hypothetical protein